MRKSFLNLLVIAGVAVSLLNSCGSEEKTVLKTEILRPVAKELDVFWELKENGYKNQSKALTAFTIKNNSEKILKRDWALYFHQPRTIDAKSIPETIKITHINGDYFKIEPTEKFKDLKKGETVTFEFLNDAWFLKTVDAPTGVYIVFTNEKGEESAPELIENISTLPFTSSDKLAIDGKKFLDLPTAASLFDKNALIDSIDTKSLCPITPTPFSYKKGEGVFQLTKGAVISFDKSLESEASFLVEKFGEDFGVALQTGSDSAKIILEVDSNFSVNGKNTESYSLQIDENSVRIKGSDAAAVFYGIQSLRALVPVENYSSKKGTITLSQLTVKDAPRFDYRGMHLDVVRNFQSKESVLKLIDLMAFYKLNKFHFHISDDEGWRLEIDGLPELTEIGSKRGHTKDESDMLNPAYGSGPYPSKESNGTGFYSKEDFVEILNFAKERHIEVIPELDFPGHARAAIISMKARQKRLLAEGKEKEANQYVLHDENDASTYSSVQLYDDNVICVCQESTYDFIEKVVSEVVGMYKEAGVKLENVHIGGDEVPHPTDANPDNEVWAKSPKCKSFLAKDSTYEKAGDLFYYFVDRFSDILQEKGITTAGWEEIGLKKVLNEDDELEPVVNKDFVSKNFRPYIWNTVWNWGAEDRGYKLANAGYKIVLSNVNNLYFDLSYDKDPNDPGYYWGGFVDTKKSWGFIPLDFYSEEILDNFNNPLSPDLKKGKERLTAEGKKNVLGIQGQLWGETVKGSEMMEYYLFPKMLGLVERAWVQDPAWESIKDDQKRKVKIEKDWSVFAAKIGAFEMQRLSFVNGGINFRVSPAGAKIIEGVLYANTEFAGLQIRYTTDGSEPTTSSALYVAPISVDAGVEVKLKVFTATGHSSKTTVVK